MILQCGAIAQIYTAPEKEAPMERHTRVEVRKGAGIVGDRYGRDAGSFTDAKRVVVRHVTFIEMEAIEAARTDRKHPVPALLPDYTRRNIVTCGIALNHTIGKIFMTSSGIRFRGVELAEPCKWPAQRAHEHWSVDIANFKEAMRHRGGIRAEALDDGFLEEGDNIIFIP